MLLSRQRKGRAVAVVLFLSLFLSFFLPFFLSFFLSFFLCRHSPNGYENCVVMNRQRTESPIIVFSSFNCSLWRAAPFPVEFSSLVTAQSSTFFVRSYTLGVRSQQSFSGVFTLFTHSESRSDVSHDRLFFCSLPCSLLPNFFTFLDL